MKSLTESLRILPPGSLRVRRKPFSTAGTAKFHVVAGAFKRIQTLVAIRDLSEDEDRGWGRVLLRIDRDLTVIEKAADVALDVGLSWKERLLSNQDWEQWRLTGSDSMPSLPDDP